MIHVEVQMARMSKIHGVPSAHFLKYCILRYIIVLSTQVELCRMRSRFFFFLCRLLYPPKQPKTISDKSHPFAELVEGDCNFLAVLMTKHDYKAHVYKKKKRKKL